ncbi:MAG: hypothetical protein GXP48_00945 [Acidobacteria bacterium]|nr:hypothetical protein [Acidobacteriota bacterium]
MRPAIRAQSSPVIWELRRAFAMAWRRTPTDQRHELTIELGGTTARVAVAGDRLASRLLPALAHLKIPDTAARSSTAGLTVELWDRSATGVDPPFDDLAEVLPTGRSFGFGLLGEAPGEGLVGYQTPAACTILDRALPAMVGWVSDVECLSPFEIGKPLQPLLFAFFLDRDIVPVHAALVAREGRGFLLGGPGGSGKSTCALSCLHAGFDFLGDDYIGLEHTADGFFRGHSFYSTSWLEPGHARRLPWLLSHIESMGIATDEKHLVHLHAIAPGRFVASAKIDFLLLPVFRGQEAGTAARPVRPAEAVLRLAPSSILQLPLNAPEPTLDRLAALAPTVPCYALELGTDLSGIPHCLGGLLARHGEAS